MSDNNKAVIRQILNDGEATIEIPRGLHTEIRRNDDMSLRANILVIAVDDEGNDNRFFIEIPGFEFSEDVGADFVSLLNKERYYSYAKGMAE